MEPENYIALSVADKQRNPMQDIAVFKGDPLRSLRLFRVGPQSCSPLRSS